MHGGVRAAAQQLPGLRGQARAAGKIAKMRPKYALPSQQELDEVGYVLPPPRRAAGAAPAMSVVLDLHETLVRLEPLSDGDRARSKGAPAGCLAGGWSIEAPESSRRILSGPPEVGSFLLHLRPGVDAVVEALRDHATYEGVLWTVGGLLYVNSIIEALEALGPTAKCGAPAFQHVVMSDSPRFDAAGAACGPSDWPFLHDCKPAALLHRDPARVVQVDDRPEYLRLSPDTALVVPPFYGTEADRDDDVLRRLAEILARMAESDLPAAAFLKSLPPTLAKKQEVGNGLTMSCIV
eukprot:TRINITY_DN378_c0_g1_i1.p1 TRINITY_DN378_c0_g1~~TRINITY_DN378_c0_g1_i1.p1  ORF type:complete len:294 (+),score=102.51 TRINITY_DN378_c0_g1_i1:90-971(+)